jgi:predicted transcriptional regulator
MEQTMSNSKELTCVTQVKERNVNLVKEALREMKCGTKQSIAQATGLSVTTCNSILNELYESNEVLLEESTCGRAIGRPAKYYQLNRNYKYICCLYMSSQDDDSPSYYHYAVMDLMYKTVEEDEIPSVEKSYDEVERLLQKLKTRYPQISVICFCISGYFDNDEWNSSWQITSFNGQNVAANLSQSLSCKVILENDLNAISYGLYNSEIGQKYNPASLVTISFFNNRGVGSGIIYDGNIVRGAHNFAGEVGFLPYQCGDICRYTGPKPEQVIPCAAQILNCYTVILNPEICIFVGEKINQEIVDALPAHCTDRLPDNVLPTLLYVEDYKKYFIRGLYQLALDDLSDSIKTR